MISIIAAVAKNNVIGKNNALPWHIPEDLKHFKKITRGKPVLMGQKTFESILGYLQGPFPNRRNIVISNDPNFHAPPDVLVFNNLEEPLQKFSDQDLFIAGGASIYRQTINRADMLYITHVDLEVPDGDAFFPVVDWNKWQKIEEERHKGFIFSTYKLKKSH